MTRTVRWDVVMAPNHRLKNARKELGLSDSQMAAALGLSGTQAKDDYRKMETGTRPVTGPVLVASEALALLRHVEDDLQEIHNGSTCETALSLAADALSKIHGFGGAR